MLVLDWFINIQINILFCPFFNTMFGARSQSPVGNHCKDGILNRCGEGSALQYIGKALVYSDTLSQFPDYEGSACWVAGFELESLALCFYGLCVFRAHEPTEAAYESLETGYVELIPSTERMWMTSQRNGVI